jgi:hypothetical protein
MKAHALLTTPCNYRICEKETTTPKIPEVETETHFKRQATLHDCLPSLLGDGDKGIKIVYDEEKISSTGPTGAAMAGQKSLVPARRAQRTNQGRTSFICTPRVPICHSFNSQRGHPSLVSLE